MFPQPKLALQLSLVLWLALLSFVAPTAILTGQVQSFGEYLSLFTGLFTALAIAYGLYLCFTAVSGKSLWLAYAAILFAILAAAFLQTAADYGGQFLLHALLPDMVMPQTTPSIIGRTALVYWCLYACNAALFWLSFVKGHAEKEKAMRTEAELSMLRLQLNPHFILNTLGSLSDLITTAENKEAAAITDKLADFLRSSLQISGSPLIPLSDELFAVESYIGVEEIRFRDRLDLTIACPAELDEALVPNFIMQPLVENVLKHATALSGERLHIEIMCRAVGQRLHVQVRNNFAEGARMATSKGLGIGLANCRARLELLFGAGAIMRTEAHAGQFQVTLEMPLTFDSTDAGSRHPIPLVG
ncbi:histidine kinase [Sphingopyxis sp.]|uniref:sensor histidine kinase n=1 Tax=Sphingopyxis sp. TaxID=1908224 RepID=UPI001E1047AE|nr:histidine kinase [Sphingopyxis sp.]MBW8294304.1 histidine kinase [Sphingopyxis sp.]